VHFIVKPVTSKDSAITPLVFSLTFNIIFDKLTLISTSISPGKAAFTMLFAVYVVSLK
jgi:hypothetical protein